MWLFVAEGNKEHPAALPIAYDRIRRISRAFAAGAAGGRMLHRFLWTLIKLGVASLVAGTILAQFGITTEQLMLRAGLTPERLAELIRLGLTWALPNLVLGSLVIVPVWFVVFLFRPPGPSSD
jgi:hypothetical protein